MRTILLPLALAAGLATGLAGCGTLGGAPAAEVSQQSTLDANDVMFAQMMIPHHEQAVELASLATTNTSNPLVLDLAARIAAAQQPEIDLMTTWLEESGNAIDMGHAMHMPGVVSDDDMATIRASRDGAFDELFIALMIAHHDGAIEMAEDVLGSSENESVIALATAIVAAQTAEIAEMNALLTP